MSALFSEYDDFALEYMSLTFTHCNMDFSPLPIITRDSAKNIKTPITIFAAENDIMFPGEKMLKRSNSIFPSLKHTVLLNNSKHVPTHDDFEVIENNIVGD
jgi:esterase/lipase